MQEQNDFKTSATMEEKPSKPDSLLTPNLALRMWPDSALTKKCTPVTEFNEELAQTVIGMMKLMYAADGVGLSACQAGIDKRIVVYRVNEHEGCLINPEITTRSDETQTLQEGCLSFPGVSITVKRHKKISFRYQDVEGLWHNAEADGLLGQMVQHELDHLDGVVFTRYLSKLKRDFVNSKMSKLKKKLGKRRELYERAQRQLESGRDTRTYDFSVQPEQV